MLPLKSWLSTRNVTALLVTLAVFSLLIKLCTWQWGRGVEKLAVEERLFEYEATTYQQIEEVVNATFSEGLTGTKVTAILEPTLFPILLLDNQTVDRKVGYIAYQIMKTVTGENLLIDLGFVQAAKSRDVLPTPQTLEVKTTVTGKLYTKSSGVFSQALMSDGNNPLRIQNLNIPELAARFNVELAHYVLQPDNLTSWPQPMVWKPLNMSSAKHFGYSFQWFVMAMVFAFLCIRYRNVLFSKR